MHKQLMTVPAAVLATVLTLVASAGASLIAIYHNGMETDAQRGQIVKLSGERCGRGGSAHSLQIVVGKRTRECSYRTPVIGRDLEIVAVERLLSATPKPIQHKTFIALELRTDGEGTGYQLAVYPLQGKAQLRKILPDGEVKYLHIEKGVAAMQGIDRPNELRLSAFNITSGPERGRCLIEAFVGGEQVANVVDGAAGELEGRALGFSVGAATNAKGAEASVDNVVVRTPNPF